MATLIQKATLLKGLISGQKAYSGPFYATIDLTRRCNLKCPDCQYHSPFSTRHPPRLGSELDISVEGFKQLINAVKSMGTTRLILTGEGEPFLHPRMFELVSIAKQAGFSVVLFTNGTLLNETAIQSLVHSRLDILKVSLWANSTREYMQAYPGSNPDYFEKIVTGLKRLQEVKAKRKSSIPHAVLHQPINKQNFGSILSRMDLLKATGCNGVSFAPAWSWHRDSSLTPDEINTVCRSLNLLKKRLHSLKVTHNISKTLWRYKIGESVWEKLPCYIAWFHARFRVNGNVLPCQRCEVPLGNLGEKNFTEIWNGPSYQDFRKQTLTKNGLASLNAFCDCRYCCYTVDNVLIHRRFKWISPFVSGTKRD